MRGGFAHDTKKETKKAASQEREREREGKMCNKRIAGQRSRIWPSLFEDDLKISLYEAWLDFIKADPKTCSFSFTLLAFIGFSLFRRYVKKYMSRCVRYVVSPSPSLSLSVSWF